MKYFYIILIFAISLTLTQCAQPRNLTGGTKDVTPPRILKLSPQNLSTNFRGAAIALEFDEYVQIKSLNSELTVSPPLKYPITYKLKGKRVFFSIKDTLKTNTTYNFNFGNAIVDLNEGNPLDSNLFVFSTGDIIDSGFIYGVVKDAYTQGVMKNVTVILYPSISDSTIRTGGPLYVTKTNDDGEYKLRYLKDTDYNIYALETPGENSKYIPLTKVGFNNNLVNPHDTLPVNIALFQELDTAQYISKEFSRDHFTFVVSSNLGLIDPHFEFLPANDSMNYIVEEIKADSFKFWIPGDKDLDSVKVFITDKTGFSENISIGLSERKMFYKKLKRKKETNSPVIAKLNIKSGLLHYFDSLRINFSRPLSSWNLDSMLFANGTDTITMNDAVTKGIINMELPQSKYGNRQEIFSTIINHTWKPDNEYGFIFYPNSFTDIINQTNDTTVFKFKTQKFEDYGSFRFTVQVPGYEKQLLVQLLDNNGKFIRDYLLKSGEEIYHKLAVPGVYKFRLVLDRNGNGKWDTGEVDTQKQPEEIIYYSGSAEVRANWDMEETWKVELK